jgi:hypothetical protein
MSTESLHQSVPRIFVSHAASDTVLARKIRRLLKSSFDANVSTMDDLSAGENWESLLRQQLSNADYVVAILSPQSVRSTFVLHDLGAAWALGKPVIPLFTRRDVLNSIPMAVLESQMIEVSDLENPEASDELVRKLSQIISSHPVH